MMGVDEDVPGILWGMDIHPTGEVIVFDRALRPRWFRAPGASWMCVPAGMIIPTGVDVVTQYFWDTPFWMTDADRVRRQQCVARVVVELEIPHG